MKNHHQLPKFLNADRIETVSRLVQNQQLGVVKQGDGDAEPLLHPHGELAGAFSPNVNQSDDVQNLVHP